MSPAVIPIEEAEVRMVDVPSAFAETRIQLWVRTWGDRVSGVPVLFVHGGPGNCVATYDNINKDFFDANKFFVVEVDQRGTGSSQPSVRDSDKGVANMQLYLDISLEQMSADFEVVRKELVIDKWLVFGGSWGSTLALDYGMRYPERCLSLIVRGIYLNTPAESDEVYIRKAFAGRDSDVKRRQLKEWEIFFQPVNDEVERRRSVKGNEEGPLDPDNSEQILREYETLILRGDRAAIWKWFVFEENLMVEDPSERLDYEKIDEEQYPEAQSVAFFEVRLFLRGAYDKPAKLLERLDTLAKGGVKTWVVQGTGDAVCPEGFARDLVAGLEKASVPHKACFVDAGHKSSSCNIKKALQECVIEFRDECSASESVAKKQRVEAPA